VKLNLKRIGLVAVAGAFLMTAAVLVFSQQPQGPRPGFPAGLRGGPGSPGPGDGFGPFAPGAPGGPFDGFGPGGPRGGFGPGGLQPPRPGFLPFGPFTGDLNLTEDQKSAIRKISESFRENDKALLDQMRSLHENQADLLQGEFSEAAVRAAAEARAKIQVELEVSHAKMMAQMLNVLTAEQKAQLAAKRQEMQRMFRPPQPPDQPPL